MKKDFDVRGFLYAEVISECEKYKMVEEQIEYLQYVMTEWKFNRPRLDPNGDITPRFEERIEIEIENKKSIMSYIPMKKQKNSISSAKEELIWWKGTEPMIMHLFQLLYNANLIDDAQIQTKKHKLISGHFKNRLGEQFDNTQLAKSFSRMLKKDDEQRPRTVDAEKIEDVLRDIRKYLKEILEK